MEDLLLFVGKKKGGKAAKLQSKKDGGKPETRAKMGQQETKSEDEQPQNYRLRKVRTPPGSVSSGRTESLSSLSSGWEDVRDGCPRSITLSGREHGLVHGRDGEVPRRQVVTASVHYPGSFDNENEYGWQDGPELRYSEAAANATGDNLSAYGGEPASSRRLSEPGPASRPPPFGRAGGSLRLRRQANDLWEGPGENSPDGISGSLHDKDRLGRNMAACEFAPSAATGPTDGVYGRDIGIPGSNSATFWEKLAEGNIMESVEAGEGSGEINKSAAERISVDQAQIPPLDRAGIRSRDRVTEFKLQQINRLKEKRLANSQFRLQRDKNNAAFQARAKFQSYMRNFETDVNETSVNSDLTQGSDPVEDLGVGLSTDPRLKLDQYLHDLNMAAEKKTSVGLPLRPSLRKPPLVPRDSGKMSWREKRQQKLLGGYVRPARSQSNRGNLRNFEDMMQQNGGGRTLIRENGGRQLSLSPNFETRQTGRNDLENQRFMDSTQPPEYDDVMQGDVLYGYHQGNGNLLTGQIGESERIHTQDADESFVQTLEGREQVVPSQLEVTASFIQHARDSVQSEGVPSSIRHDSVPSQADGFASSIRHAPDLVPSRPEGTASSIRHDPVQTQSDSPTSSIQHARDSVPSEPDGPASSIRHARDERKIYTAWRVPDLLDRLRKYKDERAKKRTDSGNSTMKDPEESDTELTQCTAISGLGKNSGTESEIDDSKTEAPDSQDEAMDSEGEGHPGRESQLKSRNGVKTLHRQHTARSLPQAPRRITSMSAENVAHVAPSSHVPPMFVSQVLSSTTAPADQKMFKVVLAGDAAVGKSSFILRLCKNEFRPNMNSTLGVDFQMKMMVIDDTPVTLQIWDTAGQERFRSIAKSYFRRADGVLLLYDCTYEPSFMNVREWVDAVEDGATRTLPIMLCANKLDLRNEAIKKGQQVILKGHGEEMAREHGALFCETSAKEGDNVQDAVEKLMRQMMQMDIDETSSNVLDLNKKEEKKSKCCGGS